MRDSTGTPRDSTAAKRPAVKKRKPLADQVVDDVKSGTIQLIEQGKAAVEKVKSGYRKVKKHLGG